MVAFDPEPFAADVQDHYSYLDMTVGASWYFLPSDEIYIFLAVPGFISMNPTRAFEQL